MFKRDSVAIKARAYQPIKKDKPEFKGDKQDAFAPSKKKKKMKDILS